MIEDEDTAKLKVDVECLGSLVFHITVLGQG